MQEAYAVLWWIPAGEIPSLQQAAERLENLEHHGPGPRPYLSLVQHLQEHVGDGAASPWVGVIQVRQLQDGAAGSFTIPDVCKITVQRKPATPAKTMANPFKPGEMMDVAAKPARNVVKVKPVKALSVKV